MRYVVLLFLALAAIAGVCYAVYAVLQYFLRRHRQRQLARTAPQLLQYEDLDPRIAQLLVQRQKALEVGTNIVSQMLNDPVMLIPTEYSAPLEAWVNSNRKELGK